MKVGSIVECVMPLIPKGRVVHNVINVPVVGQHYSIREITDDEPINHGIMVRLNEIIIGYNTLSGEELVAPMKAFREIEFPPNMEAEITECLTKKLETV